MKYLVFIIATVIYLFILVNYFEFSRNLMIGATVLSSILYFNLIKSTFPKGVKHEIDQLLKNTNNKED